MENAGKENSSIGKTKGKGTSPESFKIMGQVRDRKEAEGQVHSQSGARDSGGRVEES